MSKSTKSKRQSPQPNDSQSLSNVKDAISFDEQELNMQQP